MKIVMKRIYSLIAAAATIMSAASCVQELMNEGQYQEGAVVFTAQTESADTKAVLGTSESGRPQTMWENGDQITIHNGEKGYVFSTSTETDTPKADFVYDGDDFTAENGVVAIYPAGDYTVDIDNRRVKVTIPTQQQAVAGSYDREAVPAVAYSTGNTLNFKNIGGLIKFTMNQEGVSKVRFSANGSIITGSYNAVINESGAQYEYIPDVPECNINYAELSVPSGETFQKSATYYISVMPNGYPGFLVEFLDEADQVIFSKSYNGNISVRRNKILNLGKVGKPLQPYGKLYVVGSYNAWRHEYNTYIFDHDGSDNIYEGIVDFNACGQWGTVTNEFKFTGGNWGVNEYSQSAGDHLGTEPEILDLVEGGGNNINAYQEYRFSHFTFNKESCTLTRNYAFNSIGVIGDFNGWTEDVKMNFNPETQKFWVDVDFVEDGRLKFRLDEDWNYSFGCKGNSGRLVSIGDEIPVTAGQYRIYVDMNELDGMTYTFDADAYGTEECVSATGSWLYEPEPEPEPDPVEGWALIGAFNDWDGDELMTEIEEGLWVITDFALEADQQWKLRKDGSWLENRGGQIGADPYYITVGETFVSVSNGPNMAVSVTGTYNITFNENTDEILVEAVSAVPSSDDYIDEYGVNHGQGVEIDGVVWAPVNCGYHATDYKYGKLYQWGRKYGQGYNGNFFENGSYSEKYYDLTAPTVEATTVSVATGNDKTNENVYYSGSNNWASDGNTSLWSEYDENLSPLKTDYDPCPEGWRISSYRELYYLVVNYSSWTSNNGQEGIWFTGSNAYSDEVPKVFFPAAGIRIFFDGVSDLRGWYGYYWSNRAEEGSLRAFSLTFNSSAAPEFMNSSAAQGCSVRCVKE